MAHTPLHHLETHHPCCFCVSVSWISGLSGSLWSIGSLPLPAYLSFFLSLFSPYSAFLSVVLSLSLFLSPLCFPCYIFPHPSISPSLSQCFVSSAATNWVLPPSESSNLSVHGLSANQVAGSSQFGSHCVLAVILAVSLSLSPPLLWSFSLADLSLTLFLCCFTHSLHLALTSLNSCPPFLSHINSKMS